MDNTKRGLIATIFPTYFLQDNKSFGSFTNCFTFMQGFDENFVSTLGVKTLRPENLGWTDLKTVEEWIDAVSKHFSPKGIKAQAGSVADREGDLIEMFDSTTVKYCYKYIGLNFDAPYVDCICFPLIDGACDYHFAVYNGKYWMEQAGRGGALNIWDSYENMSNDVYGRKNNKGRLLYVPDSHFFFRKKECNELNSC